MVVITITYTNPDATFATADEAYANKNSLYPAELTQKLDEFRQAALAEGILLENDTYQWDQSTHTLTITRKINNVDKFSARAIDFGLDFGTTQFEEHAVQAGWSKVNVIDSTN